MRRHRSMQATLAIVVAGLALASSATPARAVSHQRIEGSGSSWSANAVNQWIADVYSSGLQVVYSPSGSATGRKEFAFKTNDFAVSDIGFLGHDPISGDDDTSQGRQYAYLPIVAGGTAFPYQIKVAGQLVRNLRLSGQTIAEIFANQIKNWNDPQITADNNGHALPSIPIIPVVHSEGSGSTAQFTAYLDDQFPSIWRPYFGKTGSTEYYPRHDPQIAQNGSDGVMNYVASKSGQGTIGYDEYSYALNKNFPVAKVLNAGGYYTLPNQYNVAVALQKAQINQDKSSPDYLLQKLHGVYTYTDSRTYPLSSYSYMIEPTGPDCGSNNPPGCDSKMNTAKRQTLADYLAYSICQGQKEMGPLGYSPLPINLVQASFDQTAKLKQADPGVDLTSHSISSCNNPTFIAGQPNRNYLAEIAPRPPSCDRKGQGPCTSTVDLGTRNPRGHGDTGRGAGGGGGGGANATTNRPGVAGAKNAAPGASNQPGQVAGNFNGDASQNADAAAGALSAVSGQTMTTTLAAMAGLMVVLLLVGPSVINARLQRRDGGQP